MPLPLPVIAFNGTADENTFHAVAAGQAAYVTTQDGAINRVLITGADRMAPHTHTAGFLWNSDDEDYTATWSVPTTFITNVTFL